MPENNPATPTPDDPKKPARNNSLQDTKQANEIAYAERFIETIRATAVLKAALANLGFDDPEIVKGAGLQANAFDKYSKRQAALAQAEQDLAVRKALFDEAEAELSSYRQTVQTLYKGPERANLGASGSIPSDMEVFETTARTAYTTAQKEPYASKLATRAFKPVRISAALKALTVCTKANTTSKASIKAAAAATKVRNVAVKAMNDWVAELKRIAKANLKKNPELLALLKQ